MATSKQLSKKHDQGHSVLESIRAAILDYRLQTAAHFDLYIDVHQAVGQSNALNRHKLETPLETGIMFSTFGSGHYRLCRVQTSNASHHLASTNLEVYEQTQFISLQAFLANAYPVQDGAVTTTALALWWSVNGKSFNWARLPTETKEHIIGSCIESSHIDRIRERTIRLPKPYQKRPGSYELSNHLGQWSALLAVSHQVRSIALRVCFAGCHQVPSIKGFCVHSTRISAFGETLLRMGGCLQMTENNSLPTNSKTLALARTYKAFPNLFPELKTYATLRHGIRRICLQFDFEACFEFFDVTTNGYQQNWTPQRLGYKAFDMLPELRDILIILPEFRGRLENKWYSPGPPLFCHSNQSCPRILHQMIYEQVAIVLAKYKNVQVCGFMDDTERERFNILQKNAILQLKFTSQELQELYSECDGGIRLKRTLLPGFKLNPAPVLMRYSYVQQLRSTANDFWPPKCRCAVHCRRVVVGH